MSEGIYKRGGATKKDGKPGRVSWMVKYDAGIDPLTKKRIQRYATFKTEKEAKDARHRLLSEVNQGTAIKPAKLTTAEWLRTWLNDFIKSEVTQRTWEGYQRSIEKQIIPYIGGIPLQKLTPEAIKKMYTKQLTSGHIPNRRKAKEAGEEPGETCAMTRQSVLHFHRVLFQALRCAAHLGKILRNPAEAVNPPRPVSEQIAESDGEEVGPIKALEKEELHKLFEALRGKHIFPMVFLAAATGVRRGELLAIRWGDVDFEKKNLRINKAIEVTKEFGLRIKFPKNKASRRTISMDDILCAELRKHRQAQEEVARALGILCPIDCLVFPNVIRRSRGRQALAPVVRDVDFTRPWSPDAITKEFHRAATAAGFNDLRFHDLRHTHATQLLEAGLAPHIVASRLGHSTPAITMSLYAHVLSRADEKAAVIMGELMRGALDSSS